MRLDQRSTNSCGVTFLTLTPIDDEDIWYLRNLICENDTVKTRTTRKVVRESASGSSSGQAEKIVVTLILKVVKLEYDPDAPSLRVSGKNISENEHVPLGAFHTFDIQLNSVLSLGKMHLSDIDEEILREATDDTLKHSDLVVLAMHDGLANLCLLSPTRTIILQRIEHAIPKKRRGGGTSGSTHDKAMHGFFKLCLEGIRRGVRWDVVKAIVVGSPGVLKYDFMEYMFAQAQQEGMKEVLEAKGKFMGATLSSAHAHAIKELYANPDLSQKVTELKNARESIALQNFYTRMNEDPDCVTYGPCHVTKAVNDGVVDVLMISDTLLYFKHSERAKYVRLIKQVEEMGGVALRFSSLHFTGQELNRMTGIAAILRYSYPLLDEIEEELVEV